MSWRAVVCISLMVSSLAAADEEQATPWVASVTEQAATDAAERVAWEVQWLTRLGAWAHEALDEDKGLDRARRRAREDDGVADQVFSDAQRDEAATLDEAVEGLAADLELDPGGTHDTALAVRFDLMSWVRTFQDARLAEAEAAGEELEPEPETADPLAEALASLLAERVELLSQTAPLAEALYDVGDEAHRHACHVVYAAQMERTGLAPEQMQAFAVSHEETTLACIGGFWQLP